MDPRVLSTTTATAGARDATPPLQGAIRDGGFAALIGVFAAQAAVFFCTRYGAGALAEQCAQLGGQMATTVIAATTGVGAFVFTGIRKWLANRRVRAA